MDLDFPPALRVPSLFAALAIGMLPTVVLSVPPLFATEQGRREAAAGERRGRVADDAASVTKPLYPARVSENHRFLLDQFGKPFFYMGDTAWELFHRLDRQEADVYLKERARQRFNVIMAVVLAEHGYEQPNPQGHRPLVHNDPTQPDEAYFADVDWIVNRGGTGPLHRHAANLGRQVEQEVGSWA